MSCNEMSDEYEHVNEHLSSIMHVCAQKEKPWVHAKRGNK